MPWILQIPMLNYISLIIEETEYMNRRLLERSWNGGAEGDHSELIGHFLPKRFRKTLRNERHFQGYILWHHCDARRRRSPESRSTVYLYYHGFRKGIMFCALTTALQRCCSPQWPLEAKGEFHQRCAGGGGCQIHQDVKAAHLSETVSCPPVIDCPESSVIDWQAVGDCTEACG